jgi:hypothetical protein
MPPSCLSQIEIRSTSGTLGVAADAGGVEIGVQVGFEIMVGGQFMALAVFLVQPDPPPFASTRRARSGLAFATAMTYGTAAAERETAVTVVEDLSGSNRITLGCRRLPKDS